MLERRFSSLTFAAHRHILLKQERRDEAGVASTIWQNEDTARHIVDERGKYDLDKLNPIIYDEERREYRAVGKRVADAFKAGLSYR